MSPFAKGGGFITLIVCLDNNSGIMFNKRRQSRDKNVIADIVKTAENRKIYVSEYSKSLFSENSVVIFNNSTVFKMDYDDYVFIENLIPENIINFTKTLIIYRWNTDYPYDMQFEIDLSKFKLISSSDFVGNSHKKITKEIYKNEKI